MYRGIITVQKTQDALGTYYNFTLHRLYFVPHPTSTLALSSSLLDITLKYLNTTRVTLVEGSSGGYQQVQNTLAMIGVTSLSHDTPFTETILSQDITTTTYIKVTAINTYIQFKIIYVK